MKFDLRYKPWLTAGDESRPILSYVLCQDNLLIASDGFTASIVPCVIDPDDVPGLIPAHILQDVHAMCDRKSSRFKKHPLKGQREVPLEMRADSFNTLGQSWQRQPDPSIGNYPNVWGLFENISTRAIDHFAFNPELAARAAEAIGDAYAYCRVLKNQMILLHKDPLKTFRVALDGRTHDHLVPEAPFALFTPIFWK